MRNKLSFLLLVLVSLFLTNVSYAFKKAELQEYYDNMADTINILPEQKFILYKDNKYRNYFVIYKSKGNKCTTIIKLDTDLDGNTQPLQVKKNIYIYKGLIMLFKGGKAQAGILPSDIASITDKLTKNFFDLALVEEAVSVDVKTKATVRLIRENKKDGSYDLYPVGGKTSAVYDVFLGDCLLGRLFIDFQ